MTDDPAWPLAQHVCRIGYADFALYGQLTYFTLSGTLTIPANLPNLRAFFERIDRISSAVDT